jgi:hypothetical protein
MFSSQKINSEELSSELIVLKKEIIGICAYEPGCDTVSYSYTLCELGKRKCNQLSIMRCDEISKMCRNINCNLVFTHNTFPTKCYCS